MFSKPFLVRVMEKYDKIALTNIGKVFGKL